MKTRAIDFFQECTPPSCNQYYVLKTQESGVERVTRQAAFLELIAYGSPSDAELLAAETKSVTFGQFGQNMIY
jgi:hypothetical protein